MSSSLELRLQAGPQAAARALDAIEAAAQEWGIATRPLFQIQLAVDEAISNIVNHGYSGKGGDIILRLGVEGHDVWVEIRDRGIPFDPTASPEPRLNGELETRARGGMGIHLMRQAVDEMRYWRVGEMNILRMVKRDAIP